jgi:exonuclease III
MRGENMRIIVWNCHQAFSRKLPEVLKFNPDILLVSECASPQFALENQEAYPLALDSMAWSGDNKKKGLGLFVFNQFAVPEESISTRGGRFNIKASVSNQRFAFEFLALWTQKPGYIEEAHKSIQFFRKDFAEKEFILAGDLNSNKIWDKKHRPNHSDLVSELERDFDLVSVYHHYFNEPHGKESQAAFYFHFKKQKPYHIDYIFIPRKWVPLIKKFEVGVFEEWGKYSDHCPLILDIDLEGTIR